MEPFFIAVENRSVNFSECRFCKIDFKAVFLPVQRDLVFISR